MKKTVLRQYARLIAEKGVSTVKGDLVVVYADLDQPEFVKMVVEECYKAGAARVDVEWSYDPLTKINVRYRSLKTLSTMDNWQVEKLKWRVEKLPSMIYLESSDPDGQKGINQEKVSKSMAARYKIIKPLRDQMENKYKWCIAAVPGEAWAKKVFPGLGKNAAMEKLWDAILFTSRAYGDPVANWDEHNADLTARCAHLNSLGLASLEYKSKNGTDFQLEELQTIVGGYIEILHSRGDDTIMVINEEGKIQGLPENINATIEALLKGMIGWDDHIVGDVLVCKSEEVK